MAEGPSFSEGFGGLVGGGQVRAEAGLEGSRQAGIERFWLAGEKGDIGVGLFSRAF